MMGRDKLNSPSGAPMSGPVFDSTAARATTPGSPTTASGQRPAFPSGHVAWSAARRRLLDECERAFYWRYLGARQGWKAPLGTEARRAWALKHLTALPLLTGTAIHAAARHLLIARRDGTTPPTPAEAIAAARLALRQVWLTSMRYPDRFWSMPGAYTALLEVIYRGALTDRETAVARERIDACIEALYTMPLLEDLAGAEPAEIRISDGTPDWFTTGAGGVIWVEVDLAYRHRGETPVGTFPGGVPVVADFKTGAPRPEEERIQLAACALYLRDVLGWVPADGVFLGRLIYLGLSRERWVVIGADELRAFEGLVAEDLVRMERMFVDPTQGLARAAKGYALASNRSSCARCAFQELCRPEIGDSASWGRPPCPRRDG
jgi:hypothetical protein